MATLTTAEMARLLEPFVHRPEPGLLASLSLYLDLLLKWNASTNLTAIRAPEEIVTRHFGESLFAATHLGSPSTLLDYGSGAGFPGVPIALLRPEIAVCLAEAQNKKAAFLREAVRQMALKTEVWPARVDAMPPGRMFDCVTLRAVDHMEDAVEDAAMRGSASLVLLTTRDAVLTGPSATHFPHRTEAAIPGSEHRVVLRLSKEIDVPRGT